MKKPTIVPAAWLSFFLCVATLPVAHALDVECSLPENQYDGQCNTVAKVACLPAGHWCEVPNSHLRDVGPSPEPPGNTGLGAVINAWSGGAYDTQRDYFVIWGGGHLDYAGNEVYAFDVKNLEWLRLTDPYCPEPITDNQCAGRDEADYGDRNTGEYPDGTPGSRHTYNMVEYVASIDSFCIFGGSQYPGGDGTSSVHCLDFDDITPQAPRGWVKQQDMPDTASKNRSAYDPVTGHNWTHGGPLFQWNPISNEWAIRSGQGGRHTMNADIDFVRRKFVTSGRTNGSSRTGLTYTFDIDQPGTLVRNTLATTGARSAVEDYAYPGFVYDSAIGNFVGWVGGTSVYKLDIDTAVWTECRVDSENAMTPSAPASDGINGRWRYVPSQNAFVTVQNVSKNVFFYKLSEECGGTIEPNPPPASPTNLEVD